MSDCGGARCQKAELPRIGGSLDNLKNQAQSRQIDERGIPSKGVFTKGGMTSRYLSLKIAI